MSGDNTNATDKKVKAKAGALGVDDQFKFLIACIRHGVNGKINFEEVAKECSIVTKGAAAKRYERLMKAHDISLQGPPNPRDASAASPTKGKTGTAKDANAAAKKRKATESDAAPTCDEDDEQPTPAAKKKAKKAPKAKDTVVKSEEDESPEASPVPQHDGSFDDAPTSSEDKHPKYTLTGSHYNPFRLPLIHLLVPSHHQQQPPPNHKNFLMKQTKKKAFAKSCHNLFLTLLYSLPPAGTSTNPINLDDSISKFNPPSQSKMVQEGKMNWDDTADKNLLLQLISGVDVKLDYTVAATKFGCTVSAVRQRVGKLKLQAKEHGFALKSPDAASGTETNAAETSPLKGPKTPKKASATSKQKAALLRNDNDGSASDTANEESTPVKPTTAKKPRAPRKPKLDSDGEPVAKKQRTAATPKVANKAIGKELQAKSTIKKEEGSDDEDSLEKKRKYGMMDGDDPEEENALDGVGNQEDRS
ncbi:MAG: hypothetical protein Q9172_004270 [Xanthocarpia lactea]